MHSGFCTNHMRMSEIVDSFVTASFNVNVIDVINWEVLPTPRSRMNTMFAQFQEDKLCISGFVVLLRKKKERSKKRVFLSRTDEVS